MGTFKVISEDKEELAASIYNVSSRWDSRKESSEINFTQKETLLIMPGPHGDGTIAFGRATRILSRVGHGSFGNLGSVKSARIMSFMGSGVYCHILIDILPALIYADENAKEDIILVKHCDSLKSMIDQLGLKFKKIKLVKGDSYIDCKKVNLHYHYNQHSRKKNLLRN